MNAEVETAFDRASLQGQVHAWYCQPSAVVDAAAYENILSAHELARYRRFFQERDRASYLAAHVMLRQVLSRYVGLAAADWQFVRSDRGKPALQRGSGVPDIRFNLTHTDGLAACVVCLEHDCGIDAESMRRKNDIEAVSGRMLARQEHEMLQHEDDRAPLFYRYWTLREAYVKALGSGLSGSSDKFYFEILSGDREARLHHKGAGEDTMQRPDTAPHDWQFELFQPTPEHVLSIAVQTVTPLRSKMIEFVPDEI